MTSATTPAPPAQLNATAAAAPSSTSGTTTPSAAVPAQQPTRSYASAATKSVQDNGKASPVNGAKTNNSSSQPASSSTTTAMQNGDHGRKPSVIISASGTSGQIPNGAPVGQSSRPNINFGSINGPSGSPAIASSAPHPPQTPALNAPRDPRVTSPTHSPSPIPQPAASGGKPPSTLPGQSNGLSFGSMGADNGDANVTPPISILHLALPFTDIPRLAWSSGPSHTGSADRTPPPRVLALGTQRHEHAWRLRCPQRSRPRLQHALRPRLACTRLPPTAKPGPRSTKHAALHPEPSNGFLPWPRKRWQPYDDGCTAFCPRTAPDARRIPPTSEPATTGMVTLLLSIP